jgi:hypothetical protein
MLKYIFLKSIFGPGHKTSPVKCRFYPWAALAQNLLEDRTYELLRRFVSEVKVFKKTGIIQNLPYNTNAAPIVKVIVIWKSNKKTDAIDDKIIEIEVANPFKMLSAY